MGIVLFLISTLGLSIVAVVALLILKRYEMTTGRVVLGQARPKIGAFFATGLLWIERVFPALFAQAARRSVAYIKKIIHEGVARGILAVERALEWVLKTLHYTTHPTSEGRTGEVSTFLREVAEYKKKLIKQEEKE